MSKKNDLPRWDLTNVYPSLDSKEFKDATKKANDMVEDLEKYLTDNKIDPAQDPSQEDPAKLAKVIAAFIDKTNDLYTLFVTNRAYIFSIISTDSYNDEAQKAMSEWQITAVKVQQIIVLFQGWLGKLGDKIDKVIGLDETVEAHEFMLRETVEQSKYLMSPVEESLASELNLSGQNAWSNLHATITTQLKWKIENEEGEVEELPITAVLNLRNHPSETMRRRGYEAELEAWKTVENQLAACMNGVKGAQGTLFKRRGREDAVHKSIDQGRLDRETLEAMLSAMKDSFPMFRRYFKSKAQKLGKKSLPWWELFAPMGKLERSFSYPEAQQFVLENFATFSQELSDFAKRAFDHNWIDVGPRDGKRAGAFCMGVPAKKESRILLNFEGNLDWVFTLAHELGHGYHNECLKIRTNLQQDTPFTMAETASIMCETIVTNAAIKEAVSPQEELAILETSLNGDSQVVVDIYSRYLFENEVYNRRAKSALSAQEFNEIMEWAQKETYGDGLDENYLQKYMWTWKPHYYRTDITFYNYPYAFGLLFGTGVYAIYKERGEEFVPQYVDLLSSTGMGTAADLASRFDIDLRSPEFWKNSLKVIGEKIDRYEKL